MANENRRQRQRWASAYCHKKINAKEFCSKTLWCGADGFLGD
jgi:hypothetical protein